MEPHPHRFHQVGVPQRPGDRLEYFELVLREMTAHIGRPPPEVRGYLQTKPEQSERTWRVVCTVRGRQVAPVCGDIEFEVMDRSWEDGLLRVMQFTIARLAEDFADRLQDTPFRYIGRRDDQGRMTLGDPHPEFAHYLSHTEYLLQHTQRQMDSVRVRYEFKEMDCWMHTRQLKVWKLKFKREEKQRLAQRKIIKELRKNVVELTTHTEELETRVEELEAEAVELLKEKELLEDTERNEETDPFPMDLEDDDPSDHDEDLDEEPADDPLIPSEDEEEDPEERVYGSGSDPDGDGV